MLLLVISTTSAFAQETKKNLVTKRVSIPPRIDGVLDDKAWEDCDIATGFVMHNPENGTPAPYNKRSEIKVVYDDEAIYFGAYLYDDEIELAQRQITNRDEFGNSDRLAIVINPNNDSQNDTGFNIQITNNQIDLKHTPGNFDFNWNAVWDSEVKIVDDGWIVEVKIPYSALRFSNQKVQTWGLQFHRSFARENSNYTWNFIDRSKGIMQQYAGTLSGIENIKPPTRLSFSPYASANYNSFDGEETLDTNIGLDVKYGISESFTLDATLIPDFGQAAFDNVILNLGPFEQQFDEQRPFFTEGTELFNRGDLFYSRRIGNAPVNRVSDDDLLDNEEILDNPDKVNMLNAVKVSGRTKGGLGVGFFNAITEKTEALIRDTITNEVRKVITEPLANYNVLIIDQQFNKNSSVSFVNASVFRNGSVRDANNSAFLFDITNKKNVYYVRGDLKISNVRENGVKTDGYFFNARIGKSAGNFRYELAYRMTDRNYNINDLGIQNRIDYKRFDVNFRYQIFQPTKLFRSYEFFSWANIRYRHTDGSYMRNHMGINFEATTLNQFTFWMNLNGNVGAQNDYYEPRVEGRFFKHAPRVNYRLGFATNDTKKFMVRVNLQHGTRKPEKRRYFNFEFEPTYRFSDKFTLNYELESRNTTDEWGYVTRIDDDNIIFGNRDRKEVTNEISGQYNFNVKSSLALAFRHYWSPITYDEYFDLETNGSLSPSTYAEPHDINYNIWNLDLSYTWVFASGSQLVALYRNSIFNEDDQSHLNFSDNLSNLFSQPKQHLFSVKMIYYIDYNNAKNWFKKRNKN